MRGGGSDLSCSCAVAACHGHWRRAPSGGCWCGCGYGFSRRLDASCHPCLATLKGGLRRKEECVLSPDVLERGVGEERCRPGSHCRSLADAGGGSTSSWHFRKGWLLVQVHAADARSLLDFVCVVHSPHLSTPAARAARGARLLPRRPVADGGAVRNSREKMRLAIFASSRGRTTLASRLRRITSRRQTDPVTSAL